MTSVPITTKSFKTHLPVDAPYNGNMLIPWKTSYKRNRCAEGTGERETVGYPVVSGGRGVRSEDETRRGALPKS